MSLRILLLSKGNRVRKLFAGAADAAATQLIQAGDLTSGMRLVRDERFDVIFADSELDGLSRSLFTAQVRKSRLNSQAILYLLTGYAGAAKAAGRPGLEISLLAKPANDAELALIFQRLQQRLIAERRRSGRLPFRTEVQCVKGVQRFQGFTIDLNAEGALLDVQAPWDRGESLDILFCLEPGEREVHAGGRVARRTERRLGIVFEKMNNLDRQRIKQFLALHMPTGRSRAENPRG